MAIRFEPASARWNSAWRAQYLRYAEAVGSPVDDAIATTVWSWLLAGEHGLEAVLAIDGERLAGFAHVRPFPRTVDGNVAGYLDDLWVSEDYRGSGLVDALLDRVCALGREHGWTHVRWVTTNDNVRAQRVYERRAERMDLLTYRIRLDDRR